MSFNGVYNISLVEGGSLNVVTASDQGLILTESSPSDTQCELSLVLDQTGDIKDNSVRLVLLARIKIKLVLSGNQSIPVRTTIRAISESSGQSQDFYNGNKG